MKKVLPLSYIELSKKSVVHNIKQFKSLAKPGTKFSVAIKGNAYGHGLREMAEILDPLIDYFQIDSVEELELLRKVSKKETLVLGYVQHSDLEKAIKNRCILSIFSIKQLKEIEKVVLRMNSGQAKKIKQVIHIPVDAYLGREGFLLEDLPEVFKEIQKCKHVKFTGVYAHFANIEDTTDFSHAQKQINEYKKAIDIASNFGFKNLQTHISATSGLLVYETCLPVGMEEKGIHPLVRLGIGAYGMWPSEYLKLIYKKNTKGKFFLKPVLSWKTKIAQVKILPKGNTIGYGLTYKTKKETKVALIPQGYADGLDRRLSNKGEVLVHGTRCKILGRVMMNMFVIDVSHLKNVQTEDEVVIIGTQGSQEITAEEIADKIDTINYEITTHISPLLPKVVV